MITQRADKQACTRKNRQELLKEMFEQLDNNGFKDSLTSRGRLRTVAIRKSLVKERRGGEWNLCGKETN